MFNPPPPETVRPCPAGECIYGACSGPSFPDPCGGCCACYSACIVYDDAQQELQMREAKKKP